MPRIEIHADDYAISPHSSEDILSCLRAHQRPLRLLTETAQRK